MVIEKGNKPLMQIPFFLMILLSEVYEN